MAGSFSYIFSEDFELMLKKFCLTVALVALPTSAMAGIVVIDNFNSGQLFLNGPVGGVNPGPSNVGCVFQSVEQVNSACGSIATAHVSASNGYAAATGIGPNSNSAQTTAFDFNPTNGNDIIGNARFTSLTTTETSSTNTPGASHVNINGNIPGTLDFSTDSSTTANAFLKWDGGTSNSTAIGLGLNLDLLAAGTNNFYLTYKTDNGGIVPPTTTILITIYTDLTHFSTRSFTVPVTGFSSFSTIYQSFASFVTGVGAAGGANFSNVHAITMALNAPPGSAPALDFVLDEFGAALVVPEPSTYLFTAIGLSAFAALRRRRA